MSVITITYDIEKDLDNYNNNYINHSYPSYGREMFDTAPNMWPSVKNRIKIAEKNEKQEIVKEYISNNFLDSDIIEINIKALKKYWDTIESMYFDKLYKYMEIKNPVVKMKAYFTTLGICPYHKDKRYFYISFFSGLALQAKTIMHESMHIIFLSEYEDYLVNMGVNKQGILDITESLTILLNWEFKDFLLLPEYNNKPAAADLQQKVVQLYKDKKSFSEILDELIKLRIS